LTAAAVNLWGRRIGAVSLDEGSDTAAFEYAPAFLSSGIELAPIVMPLERRIFTFPALPRETFHGLPGLLADSLPDKWGHALIDTWLATQGRTPDSFNAVERLCYIGRRGMGALEFEPATGPRPRKSTPVEIDALVTLAGEILNQRESLSYTIDFEHDDSRANMLRDILRVGTSAGGARAKAIVAWNPVTNEVRSGQVDVDDGFEHWLLKFDGVAGNRDKELEDPRGYCAIEFAYNEMARACGIDVAESRLLEENGRRHFMARRFDRPGGNQKLHMQTLCAIAHFDYNAAGAYSWEQAFLVMRRMGLPMNQVEELFRRMVFNIVARNQDDHTKNIAFLMDKRGDWKLSPAFDVTYSYNPAGDWTSRHQMSMNGKRDGFGPDDFVECGKVVSLPHGRARRILDETIGVVARWPEYASRADIPEADAARIERTLRLDLLKSRPKPRPVG
jgi:serine/threonine-protein kinase HipA